MTYACASVREKLGSGGGYDEPLFAQRVDAALQDLVRDDDALTRVDLAQLLEQLRVTILGRELACEHELLVPQRVDDVHREHQLVEGRLVFDGRVTSFMAA